MKKILTILLLLLFAMPVHASVNESDTDDGKGASGLPVPRFASLRSNEVNMRTGPGTRYPIEWVLTRQGLPVEIIAEFEVWRRVRDPDGAEGWVHKSALSGKRMGMVTGTLHELRSSAEVQASVAAHLEAGSLGQVLSCSKDWCRFKFEGAKGYLPKSEFWGAEANEAFD